MSTDDPRITTTDADPGGSPGVAPSAGAGDSSRAAARLLEVAARNAEELLVEAKAEAEQVTASAREEAEQLLRTARAEAQRVRDELEQTRDQYSAEVTRLEQLERDHRDRMRQHLTELLTQIEADPPGRTD